MSQPVQRTLLLTCGPAAQEAGQTLQRLLAAYQGPAAAVIWVDLPDAAVTELPLSDLQSNLHRLAQKGLMGELAAAGWHLDRLPDVAVYLLLDAAAPVSSLPALWRDQVAHLTRHYLGGEIAPALLWLLPDPLDSAAAACLTNSESDLTHWSRGVYVLGLLNATGFRLPDSQALAQTSAELLYLLIATPLRDTPDWLAEAAPEGGFTVPGLAGWHWDAEPLFQQTLKLWLNDVFDQWLAQPTAAAPLPIIPSAWLNQRGLTWELLAPHLLSPEQQNLPDFRSGQWAAPWPWAIRPLLTDQKRRARQDQAGLVEQQETLVLRADLSLYEDEQALRAEIKQFLDENPVGGLHLAQLWLDGLLEATAQERERLLQQQEGQTHYQEFLLVENRQLENQIEQTLRGWPDGDGVSWVSVSWRLWGWPHLAWRYHQLRRLGLLLSLNLAQQAELSRQQLRYQAALHLYRQWEQIGQRIRGQVEEIGEMVQSLRRTLAEQVSSVDPPTSPLAPQVNRWRQWLTQTAAPNGEETSPTWAAPSVSLGEQLDQLDDVIGDTLRQIGTERLAPLRDLPAIEGLRWHYPELPAMASWWMERWHEAAPLWRPDETRLSELNRQGQSTLAWVVAHGSHQLQAWLADRPVDYNLSWLETGDRRHIWLLRLHGGLNAAALLPHFFAADEEE